MSAPRVAGIEHPFGLTVGNPGDQQGQLAVLRATLQALVSMTTPGSVTHLPFEWAGGIDKAQLHPPEVPPIGRYLMRHPWHYPKLLSRQPPSSS